MNKLLYTNHDEVHKSKIVSPREVQRSVSL